MSPSSINSTATTSELVNTVFGTESTGIEGFIEGTSRSEISKSQRQSIASFGLLPLIEFPNHYAIEAHGTEHVVRFSGLNVEKHQKTEFGVLPIDLILTDLTESMALTFQA